MGHMSGVRVGNVRLRAARDEIGLSSQTEFVAALNDAANKLGLSLSITTRTVRRWDSDTPPWPHSPHIQTLEKLFQRPITELGFAPRSSSASAPAARSRHRLSRYPELELPQSVIDDYSQMTSCYRRMYRTLPVIQIQPAVEAHSLLGLDILEAVDDDLRGPLAGVVAESCLLAGRIALFDRRTPDSAHQFFLWALDCVQEAGDDALGAAILAHMAFGPATSVETGHEARDRARAAHAFCKRAGDPVVLKAWLNAVDAEVETRLGNHLRALQLIHEAEAVYQPDAPTPEWLDWFTWAHLAGFKGNVLLAAGRSVEAQMTLEKVLHELPVEAYRQRAITYTDLASAAAILQEPERACELLVNALDALRGHWHAATMARIKGAREMLRDWDGTEAVHALDGRLYDWTSTLNALS